MALTIKHEKIYKASEKIYLKFMWLPQQIDDIFHKEPVFFFIWVGTHLECKLKWVNYYQHNYEL